MENPKNTDDVKITAQVIAQRYAWMFGKNEQWVLDEIDWLLSIFDKCYPKAQTFEHIKDEQTIAAERVNKLEGDVRILVAACELAQERITELSSFANLPDEGQTQNELRSAISQTKSTPCNPTPTNSVA